MIKPGEILIAKPFLQDDYFKRSVIFTVEHNSTGSLGFVFNKPHGLLLKDIFPHLKNGNFPLFEGGPVSENQLFYTHTIGQKLTDSIEISNGVFWGGNFFELSKMIENNELKSNEIKFYIGYSGWSAGQIDVEMEKEMWLIQQANYNELISMPPNKMWGNELDKINSGFKAFSDYPFDPSLN